MLFNHRRWAFLIFFSILIASYLTVVGQPPKQEWLDSMPKPLQARLAERLRLLTEYQSGKQWERHYDLLSIRIVDNLTKEEYVKRNENWYGSVVPDDLILDFKPTHSTAHESSAESGWWTIYGCAKLRNKGRFTELRASVDAYRESGDWFFSTIGVITPVDGKPQPCESTKSTSPPVCSMSNY
jgi:hypothetical protein